MQGSVGTSRAGKAPLCYIVLQFTAYVCAQPQPQPRPAGMLDLSRDTSARQRQMRSQAMQTAPDMHQTDADVMDAELSNEQFDQAVLLYRYGLIKTAMRDYSTTPETDTAGPGEDS